jgi:hypothetical protein
MIAKGALGCVRVVFASKVAVTANVITPAMKRAPDHVITSQGRQHIESLGGDEDPTKVGNENNVSIWWNRAALVFRVSRRLLRVVELSSSTSSSFSPKNM